ncbi:MAG: phosphatidylserine decarboxylase family protein [Bacteroidales bacterium]
MKLRIHKEGKGVITTTTIFIIIMLVLAVFIFVWFLLIPVTIGLITLWLLVTRFFRVPEREFVQDPEAVLAPADGKVVAIEQVTESEYFKDQRTLVSIFMSIYDVHINWFPVSGEISYYKYHPGKYLVARHPKSSELNERTTVVVKNQNQEILIRQIAGYVARRIICRANLAQNVNQAEEMGFIRFGSRLDVYLPADSPVNVYLNEKIKGGVTVIARMGN